MELTVVIGTFGDESWAELAATRAIPSAAALGLPYIHVHADTLHEARNIGARNTTSDWLCFLDADDELEAGYVDAMTEGTADLRAPSVRYVKPNGSPAAPRMPRVAGHAHDCTEDCLPLGNWLVIGTVVPSEIFEQVGGFHDWPVYEDWDLWLRCWQMGATVEAIPAAVYRAHVRLDSRNRGQLTHEEKHRIHQKIATANRVPVPA